MEDSSDIWDREIIFDSDNGQNIESNYNKSLNQFGEQEISMKASQYMV